MTDGIMDFLTQNILNGMTLQVATINGTVTLNPERKEQNGSRIFEYRSDEGIQGSIACIEYDTTVRLELNLTSEAALIPNAALLPFHIEAAENALVSSHDNPWWMIGSFPQIDEDLPDRTEGVLLQKDNLNYSIVLLCGDVFFCDIDVKGLHIRIGCGGCHELHGSMLTLCAASRPIKAIEMNYEAAVRNGSIRVPLRKERSYPKIFEKFGWCTWDAFYTEITSEKVYAKLDEFREKNIPIRWVILDCGWSTVKDEKLMAFEADPKKFPEGLAGCIKKMKREYGIEQVGVWHTFQSYWQGVHPDSPLVGLFRGCLMDTMKGRILPCNQPEKAFVFWDAWHGYMKSCGVDFVKVDNQSSACDYFEGTLPTALAARNTQIALERSVLKHFGGAMINCMGMDMVNALQRPATGISRNSDDFFPNKENSFAKHLCQNVYNSIWHSQLHYCDFDMWWSDGATSIPGGVLRAISGGPVYISDRQGISNREHIVPVVGESGDLCRMDDAAVPTDDCIYVDCETEKKLLKIYNRKDDAVALAVFNLCAENLTELFCLKAIPALDTRKKYVLAEYFSQERQIVAADDSIILSVAANDVASYSFFPIRGEGDEAYFEEGDRTRYVSCCRKTGNKVLVKDWTIE